MHLILLVDEVLLPTYLGGGKNERDDVLKVLEQLATQPSGPSKKGNDLDATNGREVRKTQATTERQ